MSCSISPGSSPASCSSADRRAWATGGGWINEVLWYWPISQLILIAIWFALVVIGFACLYWAAQSVPTVEEAFIASGSALSTLGFATPPDVPGQVIAVVQGMIGLGIVVFVFTFIPAS